MRVKSKLLLVCFAVLCCFSWLSVGYAESCDEEYLKALADNVDVSVEFYQKFGDYGTPNINLITVYGITDEIYATTKDSLAMFLYVNRDADGGIKEYVSADVSKELQIFSMRCFDDPLGIVEPLRTIELNFKKYNPYSEKEQCKGLKGKLDVCDEYYDGNLTDGIFLREIEKYNKNNYSEKIKDGSFMKEYGIWIILFIAILSGCGIAILFVKRIKKNRLD